MSVLRRSCCCTTHTIRCRVICLPSWITIKDVVSLLTFESLTSHYLTILVGPHQIPMLLSPQDDTTETLSNRPHVVSSDRRYGGMACFLYVPPGRNDMVFVDYLHAINAIKSWPLWKTPPQIHSNDAFRVEQVEGRGLGLVVTRKISAGELIYTERPIVVIRDALPCALDQTYVNGIFYRAALKELSEESKRKFFGLHNAYPEAYDIVPGILNTNCLGVFVKDPSDVSESYVGCFPTLSRINHDCRPNTKYHFDLATFQGQIRAMRDILPSQEITIAYTELDAPTQQRQASLFDTRFFLCACRTCTLPQDKRTESDNRREIVGNFIRQLEAALFPPQFPLNQLLEVLKAAGEEGLLSEYAQVLLWGSQVLTVQSHTDPECLDDARRWAQRAREWFFKIEGENSYNIQILDRAARIHSTMASS